MTIWDWVEEYHRQAVERGDAERARLPFHHHAGYSFRETDPARAQSFFEEGSRVARALNEPCWVLFYDDWRVTGLLFFQRDFRSVLDLAVQNTLEVRKPQYDSFPLRISIQRNLVAAYVGIDPAGYSDAILQSLELLEKEVPEEGGDKFLVLGSRREYALEMNDVDLAERMALRSLELSDAESDRHCGMHHSVFNWSGLCEVAWRRGDRETLLAASSQGEQAARQVDLKMELSEFLAWQAVLARMDRDDRLAKQYYLQATARVGRLRMPPDRPFYDALCAYHRLGGHPDRELEVRRRELKAILNSGRLAYESRCRNRVCKLLAEMGAPFDAELAAAREAAARLKKPEPALEELDRLSSTV